jgi:hypothetical protein
MQNELQSLSPTAQAVVEAYEQTHDKYAALAAVLRVAAEKLQYYDDRGDVHLDPQDLAIVADELDSI